MPSFAHEFIPVILLGKMAMPFTLRYPLRCRLLKSEVIQNFIIIKNNFSRTKQDTKGITLTSDVIGLGDKKEKDVKIEIKM